MLKIAFFHRLNELPRSKLGGILKSIERPKGRGLVCLRQDRTLVRLSPASGWFTSLWMVYHPFTSLRLVGWLAD
ncbi:MAG TPA: hypothetical protein PLS62_08045 [Desulfobacteraceae bacterium]|nr:hypothetical protein [Desulfobacteraceae bacterium]